MTPDEIAGHLAELRAAGAVLKRRSAREVLGVLGAVLDGWRATDSPWRRDLEEKLPASTGFTQPMVREGLARALDGWTGEALLSLALGELGSLDAGSSGLISGFDVTAVLLAGSIPMPTLLSLIGPLAVRSPVLAKAASRDPVTPDLVAHSIAETDAELGRCIEVIRFDKSEDACTRALLEADCVSITGSDEAVSALSARVQPPCRLVADGHRLSVAAVAAPKGDAALDPLAERLALDVALWDQLGCLSPIAVFTVGNASAADAVAAALAAALCEAERRWPRGAISAATARDIARERSEAELRSAAGHPVSVRASDSTAWTVVREDGPELRPAPLHRFVRVVPVAGPHELVEAIRPLGPHLAAVAVEGFGAETGALTRALANLGASRICEPGALQSPPLAWRRAGRGVLAPLARFSDLDTSG